MPSDTLLIGSRKGLLIYRRVGDGNGWRLSRHRHSGTPIAYAMMDQRTSTLWTCHDHGHWGQKLERSMDGGESFEKVESPKYPEGLTVVDRTQSTEDKEVSIPATLRYLWVAQPGGKDQQGRVYMGTEPGGLFQTDDNGKTWSFVQGLWDHPTRDKWFGGGRDFAGIHSILVDPRDSKRVLIGISCAGVLETTDGGATWNLRNRGLSADFLPDPNAEVGQDPHFMAWCPRDPDKIWQQNHCGIFFSNDGAKEWKKVSTDGALANFGFAVAVDEKDGNTAWVVPADSDANRVAKDGELVVCRTSDGGQTWTEQREGLPQDDCFDIVFRHGLDISGDRLAFGSTSGNLYVSENRGDKWTCVANNLPPIYSVRFA